MNPILGSSPSMNPILQQTQNPENQLSGGVPWGNVLSGIGMSLMSSPRNAPLANAGQYIQQAQGQSMKQQEAAQKKAALKAALTQFGLAPEQAEAMSQNEAAAGLYLQKLKQDADIAQSNRTYGLQREQFEFTKSQAKAPNTTDDIREYEYYKLGVPQGEKPLSFPDFISNMKRPQTVIQNMPAKVEFEEDKERAKSVTGFLGTVANEGPKIAQRSADLDFLGKVVSKTATGPGADVRATLDGVGHSLGLSPGTLKTQADAIKAVTNRIAPTLRQPGSGSQSDAELAGMLSSLPNIAATPGGNQLIQSTLQRAATIDRKRAQIAAEWQAGDKTASQARREIAELDRQSIFASEEERKLVENIMGGQPLSGDAKTQKGWKILGVE